MHQTKNSKGYRFESRTKFAGGNQPTEEEYSEERYLKLNQPERLPEITIGAFYIEDEYDYEDLDTEDENNNYLIDSDTIDVNQNNINLEALGMKRENGKTIWNQLVEESSQRYSTVMNQEGPEIKNVITKGRNGEERAGIFDDGMFAEMPGGENHVKAETIGRPSILRALLERASRDNIHSKKKYEEALDLKNKDTLNRINNQNKWETQIHNAVWRDTLSKSINENN